MFAIVEYVLLKLAGKRLFKYSKRTHDYQKTFFSVFFTDFDTYKFKKFWG